MISLLNVARPLAMKALQNPKILGSLLVGSVGAQQANEIQNQLSLGNISLDDVYDTLINFASSPAVSIIDEMQTTPAGEVYAPKESDIEAERKFNEELNKQITLPSEIPLDQILSTPETTTKPEPLITPDIPEQKTKVEDVGFTEAAPMPTILTAGIEPKDIDPKDISDKSYEGVQVRVKGPILEQFEDPGKGVYLVRNPDGSLTDLKGKVFENATLKVDPKAFDVRVFNANNEIVGDYNLRDDIVVDDKGRRNYVGEESIYKVNRLGGTKFDLTQSPEGTEIDKTSGKNGVLAVTKGLTTGGQHYYTMGVDFNNPVQLMEYPENPNNPRLLPTSTGEITLGNKVGEIKVKSSDKTHPLYDNIIIGKQIGKDNDSLQDTSEIIGTDSGVVINFADRKARDLEMGDNIENYINYSTYNAESDKTQSEIFGDPKAIEGHGDDPRFLFGFSKKDGSRGYAYGYLTDKNIAFVDQLTAVDGSFSPQEYKEIKDAVQNYTGADKVGGFRVSGARKGAYDKQVTILSDVTEKTISPKEYTPKMKTDIPYNYVEAVNPTKVFGEQDLRKEKYLNKTADPINYSFTSNDLDQIKSKVFKEYKDKTGVDIEQIANNFGFKMPDLDLLNNSLNRDEKARYWWQQSAEWLDGLMDQLDLTKDEKNLFLEVVSTTSGGVDPAQNLKIALGVFSDMLSNRPIRMGFKTAQSLDVLLKDKESKINSPKFRNYVDSFKYFAGTDDRIPNTTIDLQMSKIFGMNPEALAGNPDLYSLVTMVVNDLTNEVNKSIPKGEELLQPFELQAMMWTENRGGRSTNFSEVGPQVLMQMENLGYSINREDIKDINFVRDLQSTVRPFEESIKMTVESGTFSTPQGNKIEQIINSFPDDKVLMDKINQVNKSTNLSLISKSKKNPSIIEDLVSAVVGEKAEMSRLIQGFGTSEGQVGNNIIVPSVYKNNKGQMIQLSDQQRLFILSTLGKYLDQNSVSSSNFILLDDSLQIPQGTKPTTSYYVPSTKYSQKQLQELTKTSGYDFNITPVTGGFVLNTLSSQGKPDNNKIISSLENIFGKEINVGVLDTVWYGDLIERNSYEENINAFLQNDKRTDKKSGDTQSVFNDIFSKIKAISNKRDQKYQEILDSTKVINLLKKSKIELRRRGGMISVPKIPSLVNDGLVDINTIIGKINYGN